MLKFVKYTTGIVLLFLLAGCDILKSDYPLTAIGEKDTFLDKKLIGTWVSKKDGKTSIYKVRYNKITKLLELVSDKSSNEILIESKIDKKTYISKKNSKSNFSLFRYELNKDKLTLYYYVDQDDNPLVVHDNDKKFILKYLNEYKTKELVLNRKKDSVKKKIKDQDNWYCILTNGNVSRAKRFLKSGANVNDITDEYRNTVLMNAVKNNKLKLTKLLLKNHAKLNMKNKNGATALELATFDNKININIMKLLLSKEASIDTGLVIKAIEKLKENKKSASFIKKVELLISKSSAKILNQKVSKNFMQKYPLQVAINENNQNIVKLLIKKGAHVNLKLNNDRTLLMFAAHKGNLNMVKLLLAKGIDINAQSSKGKTVLDFAKKGKQKKIVKFLITKGAKNGTEPKKPTKEKVSITKKESKTTSSEVVSLKTCKGCHGKKFYAPALGKSKIVKDMTEAEIIDALKGYKNGSYGGTMKGLMKGQISDYSNKDIETIAAEIKKL